MRRIQWFGLCSCFDGEAGFPQTRTYYVIRNIRVFLTHSAQEDAATKISLETPTRATRFYKKAGLYDNRCKNGDGGAVDNLGELK